MSLATNRWFQILAFFVCLFQISFLTQAAEPIRTSVSSARPVTSALASAASLNNSSSQQEPTTEFLSADQSLNAVAVVPPSAASLILVNKNFGQWSPGVTWVDVKTLDLNGDQKADMVGRVQASGQWWAAISNGEGFTNVAFGAWASNVGWVDVQVADLNGDGNDDILGRDKNTGAWWAAISNKTSFTNLYFGTWSTAVTWLDVQVADMNNDGRDDIVGRTNDGGWWIGKSNGTTFTSEYWGAWASSPSITWVDVKLGDYTGDGRIDVIGRLKQNGQWWVGVSNGTTFTNRPADFWDASINWLDVQLGDVNGDGRMDVVGRNKNTGDWWAGIAGGTQTALTMTNRKLTTWDGSQNWADVKVADLNGDGRADILGRTTQGAWWAGISNGNTMTNFDLKAVWATNVTWRDVHLADLDGDGLLDLVGRSSAGLWQASMERAVPTQGSIVTVKPGDRRLYVQERLPGGGLTSEVAFVSRGVNWSPHSIGVSESQLHLEFAKWYQTDIPLMAQMGINTVRVYHDFGTGTQAKAILDMFYHYGIKVIMQVDSPTFSSNANLQNIDLVVGAFKNHPAILMWAVGNEWDIYNYYGTFQNIDQSIAFTEQAADRIKQLDTTHAVTSILGDIAIRAISPDEFIYGSSGTTTKEIIDRVPSVDVWGVNIYRRNSLGSVFSEWRSISNKPMYIGEFGTDSYSHVTGAVDQNTQATLGGKIWDEVFYDLSAERTAGTAVGALAFEWNDEWWKNRDNPGTQSISNNVHNGHPDGFNDEEFFGIMTIGRVPKAIYQTLKNRNQIGQSATVLNQAPIIKVTASSNAKIEIGDRAIFDRSGNGARGITVAIIDPSTGIRAKEVRHFDTWGDAQFARNTFQVHKQLADYLESLPNGTMYAIVIAEEGGLIHKASGTPFGDPSVHRIYQALRDLGSTKIDSVPYNGRWAMIGIKGAPQPVLAENFVTQVQNTVTIQAQPTLMLNPNAGRR